MPTPASSSTQRRGRVQTPVLLQMEAVECGAAALGIILAYHGRIVPLADLRRVCGVSRDGSKASNVLKAARSYGLMAKGYSKSAEKLAELETPFIVFWNFNHFLVVEGFKKDKVFLNDPAVGHRTVTRAEFDEAFTGVVLIMAPGPDFERGGHAPSLSGALRSRLSGFFPAVAFAALAGFLLVIPGLLIPAFTQVFLDRILLEHRHEWLQPLVVAMLVAVLAQALLKVIQLRCLRRLRLSLATRMSAQFFWHLLRLPIAFYAQRFAGEISNRGKLNDKVAELLTGKIAQTMIDAAMMLFYAAFMFRYDASLTLIGIAFAATNIFALRMISRRRVEANMRLQQEFGKLSGFSIAALRSIETIKSSGIESGFFRRWSGYFANASNARQDLERANQTLSVLPTLLGSLATMLVLTLGGLKVIQGDLTIGKLIAFQLLMTAFMRPVRNIVDLGRSMQDLQGDMARLDDVLAQEQHEADRSDDESSADDRLRLEGGLELRNVTFGYSPLEAPLLEGFDLTLAPGQRVALVGGTGSGKSTVARLICGLYDPWSGEVLFDGSARTDISRPLLHRSLSLVDQDVLLFSGSVRDNLTLWDSTVPEELLRQAAEDASILDLVLSLPGGFEAELTEGGANLSGGQRQRLEIARALAGDPSILVLDEATSALDAETERQVVDGLRLRGCSCIVVAHRLSTIRDCDEIIVLDRGQIVERGTHDDLWQQDGAYAALLRTDEGVEEES